MKRNYKIAALIVILFFPLINGFADDNSISFVIAPPPVGYPVFEEGSKDTLAAVNFVYASLDYGGSSMTIIGPSGFGIFQYCISDSLAFGGNIGASIMAGSEYSLLMIQVPLNLSATFKFLTIDKHTFFVTAGAGGDIGTTSMKYTIPQWVPYTSTYVDDETTLRTLMTTGRCSGGLQANLGIGDFILSPFGTYSYSAGSYSTSQESSMSYDYPSTSGSIPGYSTTILGFDLLYRPLDMSLSSMIHRTDDMTLVSLAFKWLLGGAKKTAGLHTSQ